MQRPEKAHEEVHTPTVTVVGKDRHLQWSGTIRHAMVFRARHELLLGERESGVRLRRSEDYGDPSMPLAGGMVRRIEEGSS
ncbi:hypothetical protein [Streptomyces lydicus]|uniref:hypothetical protein n=1 Tax=Streptomyces lydicus TaxID=47763 RepID=UPI00101364E1|nr:hypothetical protein [Streptomyces lydicus]MCZ1008982.1 hypothetical protein [Streptomyces lydicus]